MGRFHVDISRDISKLWIHGSVNWIFETVLGNRKEMFWGTVHSTPVGDGFEKRGMDAISIVSARRQCRIGGPARRSRRSLPKWWVKNAGVLNVPQASLGWRVNDPRSSLDVAQWHGVSLDLDGLHSVIPSFEHDSVDGDGWWMVVDWNGESGGLKTKQNGIWTYKFLMQLYSYIYYIYIIIFSIICDTVILYIYNYTVI